MKLKILLEIRFSSNSKNCIYVQIIGEAYFADIYTKSGSNDLDQH